jgi:hypothetical protein
LSGQQILEELGMNSKRWSRQDLDKNSFESDVQLSKSLDDCILHMRLPSWLNNSNVFSSNAYVCREVV